MISVGTGKSAIARAVLSSLENAGVNFFKFNCEDIMKPLLGQSEDVIKKFFQEIENSYPAFVIIEEADALFRSRSSDESEATRRIKNSLLDHMHLSFKGAIFLGMHKQRRLAKQRNGTAESHCAVYYDIWRRWK